MFSSIMAKKSYKQRCKSEKVHMGCMSGLIHMFDFRRSSKLISDGSHGIRRSSVRSDLKGSDDVHGIIFSDEDKDYGVKTIYAGRPSIKALMEEEMASGTPILKETQRNIFGVRSDDLKSVNLQEGSDNDLDLAASLMELYRNHNGGHDVVTSEVSDHSSSLIDKEHNTDAGTRPKQIPCSIEKALEAVAEAVISHQSANGKYTSSSCEARSNEFLDALQFLSLNEEFFLMLLKDPSSRMLPCLQNLYTALGSPTLELAEDDKQTNSKFTSNSLEQSEVSKYSVQKIHNSFLKEDKLVMRRPPKLNDSSRGISRIVILKPSPARSQTSLISSSAILSPVSTHADLQGQEDCDKYARHFSLRELKRRLRLAVSNNRKDTMSSTYQKDDSTQQFLFESMSTSMSSMDSSEREKAEKPSIVDKKTNPEDSGSGMGNDATHCVSSFFYEKAKKHLIERLDNQKNDTSQIVHKSEPFGKLISFSERDTFSQTDCPQEDVNLSEDSTASSALLTTEQECSSSNSNSPRKFEELIPSDTSTLANVQLDELKTDHGSRPFKEGTISQELTSEGIDSTNDEADTPQLSIQIKTSTDSFEQINADQSFAEESQTMNALPEVSLYTPENLVNEQDNHSPSAVIGLTKPSILTFSCSPENADDKEERLSPQSVLDSILGDGISPSHKTRKQDELSMPSTRILFKEGDTPSGTPTLHHMPQEAIWDDKQARLSFVKVVLEASDLLSEESSEVWYMDGSLLDTSVLAEVGTLYCLTDDAVLLFDCVEEALFKIRDNFFGCDPWVAYLKHNARPAPVGAELVQEVAKCIDSLVSNEFPSTLDEVVLKDLERGSWLDLRDDTEGVAIEVWDSLLDDLLEEMVFDLWL
ncbi:hypothetical protein E2562_009438 [Oryza meyeriana var. granulata]|uniref:DUF4378 domain-containing protein n=1 Tax=Oryza meyeriana var. granulata TaxID=110450 RepID=A0A6G1BTE0_9ORYZ|nr:hypothetical protein E2562_009438 [Oryza meyeriana var. granulata]